MTTHPPAKDLKALWHRPQQESPPWVSQSLPDHLLVLSLPVQNVTRERRCLPASQIRLCTLNSLFLLSLPEKWLTCPRAEKCALSSRSAPEIAA